MTTSHCDVFITRSLIDIDNDLAHRSATLTPRPSVIHFRQRKTTVDRRAQNASFVQPIKHLQIRRIRFQHHRPNPTTCEWIEHCPAKHRGTRQYARITTPGNQFVRPSRGRTSHAIERDIPWPFALERIRLRVINPLVRPELLDEPRPPRAP